MGDKFDGVQAGGGRSSGDVAIPEALQGLSIHETLVAKNENGELVLLRAVQNPFHGGVMVVAESGDMKSDAMMNAIKLSQMTSMLNDDDRCSKYEKAISTILQQRPNSRVIDIGTGTGLLACLAARSGARHVDAVEMFEPLADLARSVIADNHLTDGISVFAAKSTELTVAEEGANTHSNQIGTRADVVVTEIFDSALLGEACLPVISHALNHLVHDNATVIPAKATLFGVVLQSDLCTKFQDLGHNFSFHRSESSIACVAGSVGIPLHIDALRQTKDYIFLTETFIVFEFDFRSSQLGDHQERSQTVELPKRKPGVPNAVLTWWELDLTGSGDIVYSTQPGRENWQDHWLPVVYPLRTLNVDTERKDSISLSMGHDQMSFWFAYGPNVKSAPSCSCGFHVLPGGPYRIAELGDEMRNASLKNRVESAVRRACTLVSSRENANSRLRCIDVSDSSICALLASKVQSDVAMEVLSIEEDNEMSAYLYQQIAKQVCSKTVDIKVEYTPLSNILEREQTLKSQGSWQGFNILLSEPYTRAMQAYPLATLANFIIQRNALSDYLAHDFVMVPHMAQIKAQAIHFAPSTLERSFGGVEHVQGINHKAFAQLYKRWPGEQRISLPLFQYETQAASEPAVLKTIDLVLLDSDAILGKSTMEMNITTSTPPDAINLWVEYDNQLPVRTARSELALLSTVIQQQISASGRLYTTCSFNAETGTFDLSFSSNPQ